MGRHLCEAFAGRLSAGAFVSEVLSLPELLPLARHGPRRQVPLIVRLYDCAYVYVQLWLCLCLFVRCHTLCLWAYKSVQQALVKKGVNNKY